MRNNYLLQEIGSFTRSKAQPWAQNMALEFANIYMGIEEKDQLFEILTAYWLVYHRYIGDVIISDRKQK